MDRCDDHLHELGFGHLCCISGVATAVSLLTLLVLL